ncbi:TPA: beta-lactamase family protein [Pseudomonas aeruginosa]|nr:beta-lactamase family protein [Pseudomonas aeruginosa]
MFRAMHLSLLGCLLGTSGCHGLPPAPPAPSAAVGNYGEVIDYLQRHIRREMERQDVPGLALALVDDQQLVWARGFGYADRQHRINASEHTAFHAGDLSKLLIASATLQLAERGQLSLDAPLQDTLREFYVRSRFHADQSEADRAITFRRLLSHQSGLPGEHLPPLFGERPSSLGQLPAKVSGVWLSNPPGTQVAYSNLGYELVGAAIERNTGKHFEQHMREHLLDPLQMTRSSFARNALPQAQRAQGYSGGGRPGSAAASDLPVNDLWSSPVDLSRFVRMLFANGRHKERQLLRKHSVEEMFRQQNAGNALDFDCQVGLAWFLSPCGSAPLEGGIRHYEYASATRGFSAHLVLLPEQRLAAIVMSNADDRGSLTASLARQAASLMLQVRQGARRPAVQPTPARAPALKVPSPEDRRQLYGRYATRQGQIRLYERRGRLYADFGEQRVELLRDTSGWLQMRKRLLGFWPVGVDSAGQLQLDVVSYGQRRILVSRRHDQTAYLGERIEPTSLPQAWNEAVGTYRVASTGRHSYLNGLSIRIEDGFLLVRGQAGGTRSGEFILQPIDSAHAVLAGSGQGLGDTFSRDFDGLNALGYRFAQQDTKARPWLQRKESP